MYYATKYYNITNWTGLVVGSIKPWVEALCLGNGAKEVNGIQIPQFFEKFFAADDFQRMMLLSIVLSSYSLIIISFLELFFFRFY